MKKIIALTCTLMLCNTMFAQDSTIKKLDELIQTYFQWNKFNGTALIAHNGKILLENGYGLKNVKNSILNNAHTIFEIGSITKEFTATVILKFVEQKKLSLDDKLSKYYPAFPRGDSITIKNLLTHTSGIFNYTEMDNVWEHLSAHTNEQQVVNFLKNKPLEFNPGEKFSYSNSNYMLLAYIIQKIAHKPYESVVRDLIFKPLNMLHSGFDFTNLQDTNKATGYFNFTAEKTTEAPINDSTQFIGSGEMYSTVEDLYKWIKASQNNQIISMASWQQAYQPFKGSYGYGWELDTIYDKKMVGHHGRMFGFTSKMIYIPADNIFVILLNNNSDDPYLETISRKILNIIYELPDTLPPQPVKLSEEKLKSYTGIFEFDSAHSMNLKLINGHLFGGESGNYLEWISIKENYFRFMKEEVIEGDIEFGLDDSGNVSEFHIIRKNKPMLIAKKIK